jgi:hypothetical protein
MEFQMDLDTFDFRLDQWYRSVVAPAAPPEDAQILLLLDPAFTLNEQSDDSAFCVSYMEQRKSDDVNVLNVLDMVSGRFKSLADETIRLIEQWRPAKFQYENGTGMIFYHELLLQKAELKGITLPRVDPFTPRNGRLQKSFRIRKIQTLFDIEPAAIVFHRGAWNHKLFEQAEKFRMNSDARRVPNDSLDALALSCGFR